MTSVYIAGAYSQGDPVRNIRLVLAIAEDLIEEGFFVVVPHLFHLWHFVYPHSYDFWLDYGKKLLSLCDCVLRISGESKGADGEVEYAREIGKAVFYNLDELLDWKNERKGE